MLAPIALVLPQPGFAQSVPVVARPVVQAIPGAQSQRLSAALARLGRNPRDAAALVDAADAAKALADYDAAIGFYRRADEITPGNPHIKAGLAGALALNGDPVAAIPLFFEAEMEGALPSQIAADRGLAYDLVGANATAQHYYVMALGSAADEEVRMRLAISQAIAGNSASSQVTLNPLLQKQDKPGWRTRAFALAIAGDTQQAIEVSNTILPPQLAQSIAPYLRYMPRLTRAQQAAAANLGKFPRASEIGRDDPHISAYATKLAATEAAMAPRTTLAANQQAAGRARGGRKAATPTVAGGVPALSGVAARTASSAASPPATPPHVAFTAAATPRAGAAPSRSAVAVRSEPARVAPPEPMPTIERDASGELPALAGAKRGGGAATARGASAPAAPTRVAESAQGADLSRGQSAPSAPPAAPAPAPAPATVSAPAPVPAPAIASPRPANGEVPPEPGARQMSLAEIFADLGKPAMQVAPSDGAVDIRRIEPARPVPPAAKMPAKPEVKPDAKDESTPEKPDAKPVRGGAKLGAKPEVPAKAKKPAPPAHPSRIWVQIGVGRDKDAIGFDWRRNVRKAPALFKGHEPYVSDMGRTNRVLIGPFETQRAANAFLTEAKKQGFDGVLPWTSPAGQVVDPLSAR